MSNHEHLKEFEESRSSDEAPTPDWVDLSKTDAIKFGFTGFIPAENIALAQRCPFCREYPLLSKAYKHRKGDNRVVYCKTIGCAMYKFAVVLRIWNRRTQLYLTDSDLKIFERMEDIYARSYDQP